MKTCIVCGKNFDENVNGACPCCQFPAIAVLGGAEDELIRFARQYRKDYLTDMRFGVVCTTWKASGDRLVSDRNEYVYFADGSTLPSRTWCDRQLARRPDGGAVNVRLAVEKAGHSWVREVAVPNLTQPQPQRGGHPPVRRYAARPGAAALAARPRNPSPYRWLKTGTKRGNSFVFRS